MLPPSGMVCPPRGCKSIGAERVPCRLTNAAPEGAPRPRQAERHRAEFLLSNATRHEWTRVPETRTKSRPPPRSGKIRRRSSPGGKVRAEAGRGAQAGRDMPPRRKGRGRLEPESRPKAEWGCACPRRTIIAIAGQPERGVKLSSRTPACGLRLNTRFLAEDGLRRPGARPSV